MHTCLDWLLCFHNGEIRRSYSGWPKYFRHTRRALHAVLYFPVNQLPLARPHLRIRPYTEVELASFHLLGLPSPVHYNFPVHRFIRIQRDRRPLKLDSKNRRLLKKHIVNNRLNWTEAIIPAWLRRAGCQRDESSRTYLR